MTWLNPIALAGLLAIAVPVLVHLFGRPRARRQRFPSIRFLEITRQAPIRRSRPSDWLLLALRAAVIAAAAVALARPYWGAADERGSDRVSRVVVLDTSRSMLRLTSGGERAIDAGRREAQRLVAASDGAVLVETVNPGGAFSGAVAWLAVRPGLREIVVLSDFQSESLSQSNVSELPAWVGVRLSRVKVSASAMPVEFRSRHGATDVTARVTVVEQRSEVQWLARTVANDEPNRILEILTGDAERADAIAALQAARQMGVAAELTPPDRRIVIAMPGFAGREQLLQAARLPSQAWQGRVMMRLSADQLLHEAAAGAPLVSVPTGDGTALTPVARTRSGVPIVYAAVSTVGERDALVLFPLVDAGTVASSALMVAALRAVGEEPPPAEADPTMLPDELLRAWERPATVNGPPGQDTNPGRWLWLVALALLLLESWFRRAPARHAEVPETTEDGRERVA